MRLISLQSGSNGNCVFVEADGARLLIDAGISGAQAQQRLAQHGVDIREVDALLISHDHRDHARSLGIYQRKFGLPVYVTRKTLGAAQRYTDLGQLQDVRDFEAGETLRIGPLAIATLPTPHDGEDGVAFVVDDGQRRLGVLTDLGHIFEGLAETVRSLDAVLLESNYDPHLLAQGGYPDFLKRRIRGPGGHLSNRECAELLAAAFDAHLQWACLGHLSAENNSPEVALQTHRQILGETRALHVASRYRVGEPLVV